jgi:hypothetical protein
MDIDKCWQELDEANDSFGWTMVIKIDKSLELNTSDLKYVPKKHPTKEAFWSLIEKGETCPRKSLIISAYIDVWAGLITNGNSISCLMGGHLTQARNPISLRH